MENTRLKHRTAFSYFRMGLATGLVDREALIAWADNEIATNPDLPHEVIELALCGQRPYSEIIWLLNQFEGEPDHDLGLKLLFARAGVLFERHPDHANEIIYSLRLINEEEHVPRDMRAQLVALNHDLEQYKQALITQHDLEQSVSGFLFPYAVYRPQLEQIDLTR